ncbi:hypothetical protein SteCoe_12674 [Stentor coeruleus]|uniref:Uncharacterized protein n=1 Tax=Stentor coeruleus TaxID=5963 RepID=A0A1R2CA78_9CILI|nr:hypothetical protein SteCoe_12674 [Stentor coeruleus]
MENKGVVDKNTKGNNIKTEENKRQKTCGDTKYVEVNEKKIRGNTKKIEENQKERNKITENTVEKEIVIKENIEREDKSDVSSIVEGDLKNEEYFDNLELDFDDNFPDSIPDETERVIDTLSDKMQNMKISFQMIELNKSLSEKSKEDIMLNSNFLQEVMGFLNIDINEIYSDILIKLKGVNQMRKFSELTNLINEVRESYKNSTFQKTKNKLKILCRILKLLKAVASQNNEEFIHVIEKLQHSDKDFINFDLSLQESMFFIQLKTFIDMKDYVKAFEHLEQLENFYIEDQNMLLEIYFYTSILFRVIGRKNEANKLFSDLLIIENNPYLQFLDARIRLEIAYNYLQEENHAQSLKKIQEVREFDLPKFGIFEDFYELIRIFTLLGHLEIKMGNYSQAFKDFSKACEFSDEFYDEDTVVVGFAKYYVADVLVNLVLGDKRPEAIMKREDAMCAYLEDAGLLYKQCIPILSKFLSPLSLELAEAYLSAGIFYYTISNFILSLKYLRLCKKIFILTQTFNYNFKYLCKWLNLVYKNSGNSKLFLKTYAFKKSIDLAKAYYKSKSLYQMKTHINKLNSNIIMIIQENINYNNFLADYGAFLSPLGKIIQFIRIKVFKAIEFINIYMELSKSYDIFLMIIAWHEPNFMIFEWHEKLFEFKLENTQIVNEKSFSFWEFNMSFAKVMMGLIKLGIEKKFIGLLEPDSFVVNQKRIIKIFAYCEEDLKNMGLWEGFLMRVMIESEEIEKTVYRNCNEVTENKLLKEDFINHDIEDLEINKKRQNISSFKETKIIAKNCFVPPEFIIKMNKSDDLKISLEGYYVFSFSLIMLSFLDKNFQHFIEEEYVDFLFNNENTKEFNSIVRRCLEKQNLNPLIKKIIIKTLRFDCSKRISPEKVLNLLDYYLKNKNIYGINFD